MYFLADRCASCPPNSHTLDDAALSIVSACFHLLYARSDSPAGQVPVHRRRVQDERRQVRGAEPLPADAAPNVRPAHVQPGGRRGVHVLPQAAPADLSSGLLHHPERDLPTLSRAGSNRLHKPWAGGRRAHVMPIPVRAGLLPALVCSGPVEPAESRPSLAVCRMHQRADGGPKLRKDQRRRGLAPGMLLGVL
jgi:hypothetical protein